MSGTDEQWQGRARKPLYGYAADKLPALDNVPEKPEYDIKDTSSKQFNRNPKELDRQAEMNPESGRKPCISDVKEEDTPMWHSDSLPDTPDEFSYFKPKKQ